MSPGLPPKKKQSKDKKRAKIRKSSKRRAEKENVITRDILEDLITDKVLEMLDRPRRRRISKIVKKGKLT